MPFEFRKTSVAISAQAISCSNVRIGFLRHELFWFCPVPLSTTLPVCGLLLGFHGDVERMGARFSSTV